MEQQKKFDLRLNGSLTTVTPFNVSIFQLDGLPTLGGRLYIPGSSIRGSLRRSARDVMQREMGIKSFQLDDFYFLTLGGLKGSEKGVDPDALEKVSSMRIKNPLVSLFGAMSPKTIAGRLMVSHAIENEGLRRDVVSGVRSDDLVRNPDLVGDVLAEGSIQEYRRLKGESSDRSSVKAKIKELNSSLRKAEGEQRAAIKEEIKSLETDLESHKSVEVSLPNLQYQAIPQGTKLDSSFILRGVSRNEVALFLKALNEFSRTPVLGGKKNHGCGQLSGEWAASIRIVGEDFKPVGTLKTNQDWGPLDVTGAIANWFEFESDPSDFNLSVAIVA